MRSSGWKQGIVADKQRCQALLIETSRSEAQKHRAREWERHTEDVGAAARLRLSGVWLCSSLTVLSFVCMREKKCECVCVCMGEWEVFKASPCRRILQSHPATRLSSISRSIAASLPRNPFFFLSITSRPVTCPSYFYCTFYYSAPSCSCFTSPLSSPSLFWL